MPVRVPTIGGGGCKGREAAPVGAWRGRPGRRWRRARGWRVRRAGEPVRENDPEQLGGNPVAAHVGQHDAGQQGQREHSMSPTARLPGTGSAQAEAHEERHGTEGARRREDLEQEVVGVATAMNALVQANAELVLVVDRPPPDQRSLTQGRSKPYCSASSAMRPAPRIMALLFAFWPSAVMRSPPPHSVRAVRAIPRTGSMARATQASAKTVIASRPIFSSRMRLYPAQNAITHWTMRRNCLTTWSQ